ncbi:hypothetical protein NUH88_11830 [Nisaea acidiphila]|uniref:Uncharacterized protein n=1 Tax=Nisaea acidiphila TaxID=1862145 RepID=A0A9J7AMB8_9PROT|nr:hypothetical protein [Nisaea acidiphila]UUX48106.1 hypothetical protein NUH88_11830 [Nisaea acidiphila]
MSIVFNADYPGSGFVAPARSVQWNMGFAPGEGAAGIVERQLAGARPARRATDRDGADAAPQTPAEMAGAPDTQEAIRRLLAVYGEDEARDHFGVRSVESRDPIASYDIALIDPARESAGKLEGGTALSAFESVPAHAQTAIMSAEDFLLL